MTGNLKSYMLTDSTGHFPYSLMCHYSPIDLQKTIRPGVFLEFIHIHIYAKFDGK